MDTHNLCNRKIPLFHFRKSIITVTKVKLYIFLYLLHCYRLMLRSTSKTPKNDYSLGLEGVEGIAGNKNVYIHTLMQ